MSHTLDNPSSGPTLLRNRNFVLLWCAYGLSAVGDHLSEMALLKTHNAASSAVDVTPMLARITFLFFLPFLVLAPVAGGLADRFSRRGLMAGAAVVRIVLMLGFVWLIDWTRDWGAWGVFSPVLLIGAFAAVFSPARSALLPTLVREDQLVRANALLSGLGIIATMVAAAVGGYLAQHHEPVIAFRADALMFFACLVMLLLMSPPAVRRSGPRPASASPGWTELLGGLRYVRSHRHVRELLCIAALVWFCGPLVVTVIPAVVRDVYGWEYQGMSTFRALFGLGFITGAVGLVVLGEALRGEVAITWGLLGIATGIAIFSLSVFLPAGPSTLAIIGGTGVVISGLFGVTVMASFDALMQRTIADRFLGRVYGINNVLSTIATLLATGLLGVPQWARVDRWVGWILLAVALITLAAGMTTLIIRLRRGVHGAAWLFAEHLNEFIVKWWYRFQRIGPSRLPHHGPVIIASNHIGGADPMLIGASSPYRPMTFMIAAEYADWLIVRRIVKFIDAIPVRRGTRETSATKQGIRFLQEGKAMAIFIEGGIVPPGEPIRPKDGVASLAIRTGAMVIPAYISGIKYHDSLIRSLFARHYARVRMGPPVDLGEFREEPHTRDKVRAATRKIYDAILDLAPPEERAERLARLQYRADSHGDEHDESAPQAEVEDPPRRASGPGAAADQSVPLVPTSGGPSPPRAEPGGLDPLARKVSQRDDNVR